MNTKGLNVEAKTRFFVTLICIVLLIYILQLINLQLFKTDFKTSADSNAFFKKTLYPSRGTIYDRNGKLLVYNQPAYDVMVIVKETHHFDTLALCNILDITIEQCRQRFSDIKNKKKNPGYSSYVQQLFFSQIGQKEYGLLMESLYKFPGFFTQRTTAREYSYANAAHLLGYIAEADTQIIKTDSYYRQGDKVGKTGVESSYEKYLRGEKGIEILLRDARGRIKGKYAGGIYDMDPISGKNLKLSVDIELQALGEELMENKTGSIVMIEPSTGEVLCMVTSPSYDPSLLVGRQFTKNYLNLRNDPFNPLLNRPIGGRYSPGSTFKVAQGLVFLEEEIIASSTSFSCVGGFPLNGGRPACHAHASPLSLVPAIATSCNSFFCYGMVYMLNNKKKYENIETALDIWKNQMMAQGFGRKLGIDLPGELNGLIPGSEYYKRIKWNAFTIISNAIGQGEVTVTPLQICNMAATIANRGFYITPHVVQSIENSSLDSLYTIPIYSGINSVHYELIVEGMAAAVTGGTCRRAQIPGIEVCGKTGTVENRGISHSVFAGFAPKYNPKVAISVYVENAGYGAEHAVPMAKLMIEKYLKGDLSAHMMREVERIKTIPILPHGIQKN